MKLPKFENRGVWTHIVYICVSFHMMVVFMVNLAVKMNHGIYTHNKDWILENVILTVFIYNTYKLIIWMKNEPTHKEQTEVEGKEETGVDKV